MCANELDYLVVAMGATSLPTVRIVVNSLIALPVVRVIISAWNGTENGPISRRIVSFPSRCPEPRLDIVQAPRRRITEQRGIEDGLF